MSRMTFRKIALLPALALFSCLSLLAGPAAARAAAPVCEPLLKQLRWHEPFFGIRMWWEVAEEAMNHASAPCREAITAGRAKEVAAALASLDEHRDAGGVSLRRFVYRLTCQLRVPEAEARIRAGVREPGVYAECADALFAMSSSDPEAIALRDLYLDGLRKEPLTTRLPGSLLRAPHAARLAPVLKAYDQARLPRRDAIHRALCASPRSGSAASPAPPASLQSAESAESNEVEALCSAPAEREHEWAREKLLRGDVLGGLAHLALLPPARLTQFAPLLRQFDSEQRRGRDLLYSMLCRPPAVPTGELAATCGALVPSVEISWPKLNQKRLAEQELNDSIKEDYRIGRNIGVVLLWFTVPVFLYGLLIGRRKHRPNLVKEPLPMPPQ